jgi:hypothetical protein
MPGIADMMSARAGTGEHRHGDEAEPRPHTLAPQYLVDRRRRRSGALGCCTAISWEVAGSVGSIAGSGRGARSDRMSRWPRLRSDRSQGGAPSALCPPGEGRHSGHRNGQRRVHPDNRTRLHARSAYRQSQRPLPQRRATTQAIAGRTDVARKLPDPVPAKHVNATTQDGADLPGIANVLPVDVR